MTRGERACAFIETLRWGTGKSAGQKAKLLPWERAFVLDLLDGPAPEGDRLGLLFVARKNGKTALIAALGLYLLLADGEPDPSVILAASTAGQAEIVFDAVEGAIMRTPHVAAMVRSREIRIKQHPNKRIEVRGGKLRTVSRDAEAAHGLNPSAAIVDELHAHKSRRIWDALKTGLGARDRAVMVGMSTAGHYQPSLCSELWGLAEQPRNETGLAASAIFTAPKDLEWDSDAALEAANPSGGVTIGWDWLRQQRELARQSSGARHVFEQFHLNRWVQHVARWPMAEKWRELPTVALNPAAFTRCWGGLDLGAVDDLTAFSLVGEVPGHGHPVAWSHAWVPSGNVEAVGGAARAVELQAAGHVTLVEGDTARFSDVAEQVAAWFWQGGCQGVTVDRHFEGHGMAQRLSDAGVTVVHMPMSRAALAPCIHDLEERVTAGDLVTGGNPLADEHFDNVRLRHNDQGQGYPSKKHSGSGKIDIAISCLLAHDAFVRGVNTAVPSIIGVEL